MTYAVELIDVVKEFPPGEKGKAKGVVAVDHVTLRIRDGEFFSLLGPSGCGKTTTLRLIAGFETPTEGVIRIHGRDMTGIPPYRRPVNTVFQNYALFPHMTVFENVAFGLRMSGLPKKEIAQRVEEALAMVQLSGMEHRKPRQLSGGQQQRVALARALVNRPEVLLLDEPLGALDLKLRKAMQLELKSLQQRVGITFVYVTHDQEEALTMSDRIAVMNEGKVLQVGTPVEIYEQPANRFVADFIGETNFVTAPLAALEGNLGLIRIGDRQILRGAVVDEGLQPGTEVTLAIRPEKISLLAEPRDGAIPVVVRNVVYVGNDTRYEVELDSGIRLFVREQNVHRADIRRFTAGQHAWIWWPPENARILVQ
ncbi:MAG: ABC transporter ATP-binding protein [Chloroflexi bacterium]|nr:ABC transporter ATP-binding protein [Chloroflexota bacterium]